MKSAKYFRARAKLLRKERPRTKEGVTMPTPDTELERDIAWADKCAHWSVNGFRTRR